MRVCKSGIGVPQRMQLEPLFPGYVFMHVDPGVQSISPVRSTRGVLRFVRFGNQYASASADLMNQIMVSVSEQLSRQDLKQTLRKGDVVKINGNGFNNVKAIFSRRCGNERALILLMILGRESRVTVPIEAISRATN
jgi:transcriptional antiterminator RfaH